MIKGASLFQGCPHRGAPLYTSYSPDIERDGHKCVQYDEVGNYLQESQLNRSVLIRVVVISVDGEGLTVDGFKDEVTDETDNHTCQEKAEDLEWCAYMYVCSNSGNCKSATLVV